MPALQLCPHCQAKAERLAPWGWSQGLLDQRVPRQDEAGKLSQHPQLGELAEGAAKRVLSAQIRLSIRRVAMDRREEPA